MAKPTTPWQESEQGTGRRWVINEINTPIELLDLPINTLGSGTSWSATSSASTSWTPTSAVSTTWTDTP